MDASPRTWWPLTRKMRSVAALALLADAGLLAGALTSATSWNVALSGIVTGTAAAIAGYWTSETPA